ncbi:MAG: ASKHA domain-containing protein [Desulfobacterales bacterium]
MSTLTILPFKKHVTLNTDESVLKALRRSGFEIEGPCNGQGICGKCRVRVEHPEMVLETPHRRISESDSREKGIRLACRLIPQTDIILHLPDDFSVDARILEGEHLGGVDLEPAAVVSPNGPFKLQYAGEDKSAELTSWRPEYSPKGLAIDIGTTTLVMTLFCLQTGKQLSTASSLNPQTRFGHDVVSRIQMGSTQQGLVELAGVIRKELNKLISEICKNSNAAPDEILDVVIGGNTTMLELAAAINPEPLGHLPFRVDIKGGAPHAVNRFDLDMNPAGKIYIPPIVHAFVGSDITAGVLACDCLEKKKPSLFVDIGTNGEMGLNSGDRFIVASTAAGPAFEGMGVSCGIRAVPGAVESVYYNGETIDFKTIDGRPARGICGSGIIDTVAALLRAGVVDSSGRMKKPAQADKVELLVAERLQLIDGNPVFQIAEDIYFTQADIRQIQLAKGAIRTGIDMLLAEAGVAPEDLDEVILAGAFGHHLRPESLATLGLIPEQLSRKVRFAGNTSKTGCAMLLLNTSLRTYLEKKVQNMEHLPLAEKTSFQDLFIENLNFPQLVS